MADPEFRLFSKPEALFTVSTFTEVLFKLSELVKAKIKEELQDTQGAIMYDGWTNNSTHYLALYGLYNRTVTLLLEPQASSRSSSYVFARQ